MTLTIGQFTLNNQTYTVKLSEHVKDKQSKLMTNRIIGALMMIDQSLDTLTDPEFMIGDPSQSYTFVLEKIDQTIIVNAIVPNNHIHTNN